MAALPDDRSLGMKIARGMTDNGAASQKVVFERNDNYNGPRPALAKKITHLRTQP